MMYRGSAGCRGNILEGFTLTPEGCGGQAPLDVRSTQDTSKQFLVCSSLGGSLVWCWLNLETPRPLGWALVMPEHAICSLNGRTIYLCLGWGSNLLYWNFSFFLSFPSWKFPVIPKREEYIELLCTHLPASKLSNILPISFHFWRGGKDGGWGF